MVDLSDERQVARRAGYTASYCGKTADKLPEVKRLNGVTGEIRYGGLRAWSASWRWGGASMKRVQARRRGWWSTDGAGADGARAEGALDLCREIYAVNPFAGGLNAV